MNKPLVCLRYTLFVTSLFFCALGVSIITTGHLGTSPITSVPYVLSYIFPLSLGTFTFFMNVAMVFAQWALLRKKFPLRYWLQVPTVLLFSMFIDMGMRLVSPFITDVYYLQLGMCVAGSALLALGIALQIAANASVLPVEGLVLVIAYKMHKVFGKIKVLFDCSMVLSAVLLSLLVFHDVVGLREGTILSALLVGNFVRIFAHLLRPLMLYCATPVASAKA